MTRRWVKTIIFSLLIANLVAQFSFHIYNSPIESSFVFRSTLILLIVWIWYSAYKIDQYEQLIVVTFFLTVFNLDKLYLGVSVPISIILVLAAFFASSLFYASIRLNMAHSNRMVPVYSLIVGLVSAESFLAASIWSPNNATLSAIVSVTFYFSWHIILSSLNHKLSRSLQLQYSIYCFVALFLIISTTSWYNNL
jgi:hypothetical protein